MIGAGRWVLVLALLISLYTALGAFWGRARRLGRTRSASSQAALLESARNGALVAATCATVAAGLLVYLLLSRDLSAAYVYEHVNQSLPLPYVLSAFWAGQEGSLLLWLWFAALLTAFLALRQRTWQTPRGTLVVGVMALTQAFLALVLIATSNPFVPLAPTPVEGRGLNPLLQNVWMIAHPPVVFAAYAVYAVPFALAVGGLVTGQLDREWLQAVRRWSLLAWLLLGAGILMGAWWAYLELGWGGYWGWDPVENASLIPWLLGTALLHSLSMQRRRNTFWVWNLWLITLTFVCCILATFITRSGIIQSVHAFGRSAIGYYFLGFGLLCLAALVVLLVRRGRLLGKAYDLQSLLTRESSLLLTNLLLTGSALIVLLGTLFPAFAELVSGRPAALDVSFYGRTIGPLALLVLALVGICPWLAWGQGDPGRLRRALLPPAAAALVAGLLLYLFGVRRPAALAALIVATFAGLSVLAALARGVIRRERPSSEVQKPGFWQKPGFSLGGLWRLGRSALRSSQVAQHRRVGAHLVHLGLVLIVVGVTGSSLYQQEVQVALSPGEDVLVRGYRLEYAGLMSEDLPAQERYTARMHVYRDGRRVDTLEPRKEFFWNVEQWVTEVDIHTTLREDLYVILSGFGEGLATLRILINPLVVWLWIGGALFMVGGLVAWWPDRREVGA